MSDDLAAYLDSIDSHLVGYLDTHRNISADAVRHVQCYAVALIQALVVPEQVHEDWPDFFPLVAGLVLAYGSTRLEHLARQSSLFEGGDDDPLTDGDRVFLVTLLAELHELLSRRQS
ncbi:MAG TPA: hypothetical protein VMD28_10420 [Acidimicrobiales bacterium]|nr:hypothetical protein [Acidimicrobiales bacterium]